jgi:3-oxoacyl-[acyl-carrier-protein] synthase-3
MKHSKIIGWGAYTPSRIITNQEISQIVDTSHEWIVQRSGIHERRVVAPNETTCSMSVTASKRALVSANLMAYDLDLIIVGTTSPDHFTPPVSSQIQHELGATNVPGFVLTTGCTGFVYALATAHQFIATGVYRNVLVIGVETLSRFMNWKDRTTCVLFGDAAGAAILQASDIPGGVGTFELGSDGALSHHIILPAGGSAKPTSLETLKNDEHYIRMNGREVFKFATRVIKASCDRILAKAQLTYDDIDWIVPHQANLRIIEAAAEMMKLPLSRFIVVIDRFANTSAASIPLAITEAIGDGRIKPGQRLLLCSFGAGLTWASAIVEV